MRVEKRENDAREVCRVRERREAASAPLARTVVSLEREPRLALVDEEDVGERRPARGIRHRRRARLRGRWERRASRTVGKEFEGGRVTRAAGHEHREGLRRGVVVGRLERVEHARRVGRTPHLRRHVDEARLAAWNVRRCHRRRRRSARAAPDGAGNAPPRRPRSGRCSRRTYHGANDTARRLRTRTCSRSSPRSCRTSHRSGCARRSASCPR